MIEIVNGAHSYFMGFNKSYAEAQKALHRGVAVAMPPYFCGKLGGKVI